MLDYTRMNLADLKGTYYKLGDLSDAQRDFLLGKGYLFQVQVQARPGTAVRIVRALCKSHTACMHCASV